MKVIKPIRQEGYMMNAMGKIIGCTIILLGLMGCSSQNAVLPLGESRLEQNWGRAYETAKRNQILDPEAGKDVEPVEGMDGDAAERAMRTYKSGGAPVQAPPTEFGVVTIKQ